MGEINWALLGAPVNVGAAVNAGYERGRSMRLRNQQESAFARLAENPNDPEGFAMLVAAGEPQIARQMQQWGREDRRREITSAFLRGTTPPSAPSAFGTTPPAAPVAPAPAPQSLATPVGGLAPVAAPVAAPSASPQPTPRRRLDPNEVYQQFGEDFEGAQELLTLWNGLNEQEQELATQRYAAAVPILAELARVPYEQRRAIISAQAGYLRQNGWSDEEIAGYDPTDQNNRILMRQGIPIAQQRAFFEPVEGAPGAVYRDRFSMDVDAANPSQPRTERSYDAAGNEFIQTVPGSPAIGPGAARFGGAVDANPQRINAPAPAGGGGTGTGGGNGTPRGIRNNNPGNVEDGPFARSQPGYRGSDGRFAIFDNAAAGERAQEVLLRSRYLQRPTTVRAVVERYAPPGENSSASINNYIAHVEGRLGIRPGETIDATRGRELAQAMREFENGTRPAGQIRGGARAEQTAQRNGRTYYKINGQWYDNAEGR